MTEYIEREAVIAEADYDGNFRLVVPVKKIRNIPAADVVERKRGKWDEIPNKYISVSGKNGSYSGNATSCSVCHEINPNAFKTNFCPNCGAKMDNK